MVRPQNGAGIVTECGNVIWAKNASYKSIRVKENPSYLYPDPAYCFKIRVWVAIPTILLQVVYVH